MKKTVAIIGTQGIPGQYGGFETLVEFLVQFLSEKFEITVFCSGKVFKQRQPTYKGCKMEYIGFHANGIQSIPYDILSILKARNRFEKILILGVSGGIIMPFLKRSRDKFVLNFGGIDWKRSKWGYLTQQFLKLSEYLAVKNSGFLIADNKGIQEYIKSAYGRDSEMIAYGGEQALIISPLEDDYIKYSFLRKKYAFSVARIQPDNNIEMILKSFDADMSMPIVFVGNWEASRYGINLKKQYGKNRNLILLDAIYDQQRLDLIRSNAVVYIHGHSAGGTNPSLVEAMNLGIAVFAFSSGFNEYTTKYKAKYFSKSNELKHLMLTIKEEELFAIGARLKIIANENYTWKIITQKYWEILNK